MRGLTFGCILIFTSIAFFVVEGTTTLRAISPLPAFMLFVGTAGVFVLLADVYARVNRRINCPPKPPYFVINAVYGRCLELDTDGSYDNCQSLLNELAMTFDAKYSIHLDPGPSPASDKDKGCWNLTLFGQDFFLMRQGGHGISIWGPKPPADLSGFLRLAQHFNAVEFTTWQHRLVRSLKAGVNDIRQIRIGGASNSEGPGGPGDLPGIPEPGTLTLLGLGGIGLAAGKLRKRRKTVTAA